MNTQVLVYLLVLGCMSSLHGQIAQPTDEIVITTKRTKTQVVKDQSGVLTVNVHPRDLRQFTLEGFVRYSDFGAVGDGENNDIDFIASTHAFANQHDFTVRADPGFTYYIGGDARTAIIQTDTDFGDAKFIIDDRAVENRNAPVFLVSSNLQPFEIESIASLKRNQKKIDADLLGPCLITVINSQVMHYIRYGLNQNNGSPQRDIFVVDQFGNVDMDAPIIWDFEQITEMSALPIDQETLTITGGKFTTIANQEESKYNYYSRNISIRRSNVELDGVEDRKSVV